MKDSHHMLNAYTSNILRELNLLEYFHEELQANEKRQSLFAFAWVNMANQTLPIAKLFEVLRKTPSLMPPRTGHIGNWGDIIEGYIGERNDNTVICKEQKLGYPLLFDLTQTEDESLQKGDLTYLPGSIVEQGMRKKIPLYTWDGTQFVERTRESPLFVPFVFTLKEEKLVPLTQIHRVRYLKHHDINFSMFSSLVIANRGLLKEILTVVIEEEILKTEDPQRELNFIVNRRATLDGQIYRELVIVQDNGYLVGQTWYEDTDSFVEAILLPYGAAAVPESFFPSIQSIPQDIPLLTNHFSVILCAILYTHIPGREDESSILTQQCNVHLQWGGIAMAGYPPGYSGYFSREVRYIRNIHKKIVRQFGCIDPIFFVLLPSSIFLLWPSDLHPEDVELVEQLIDAVHEKTNSILESPDMLYPKIESIVNLWASKAEQRISPSFMSRFAGKPPILTIDGISIKTRSIEPKGFSRLTFQQASMLVGALFNYYSMYNEEL